MPAQASDWELSQLMDLMRWARQESKPRIGYIAWLERKAKALGWEPKAETRVIRREQRIGDITMISETHLSDGEQVTVFTEEMWNRR